jgi:hypothetical protein
MGEGLQEKAFLPASAKSLTRKARPQARAKKHYL